jgi:hypothetical protein
MDRWVYLRKRVYWKMQEISRRKGRLFFRDPLCVKIAPEGILKGDFISCFHLP